MPDARDVIARAIRETPPMSGADHMSEVAKEHLSGITAHEILAALHDAGYEVVERRPVTVHESMAEEWDRYKPALDYLADK